MSKYAIITGCSPESIGFLAAKGLAAAPHCFKVILACRDEAKGKRAQDIISLKHPHSHPMYLPLDLASRDSIEKFVDDVHKLDDGAVLEQGLSLLVNNAAVGWGPNTPFVTTKDGLEEIVGVNHFGPFYLTLLLLDDLKRSPNARVVVVSSSLHNPMGANNPGKGTGPDSLLIPDFPEGILHTQPENYDGARAYRISKLCNLWFAYELQRRCQAASADVVVNALTPGFIPATGLTRRSSFVGKVFLNYILDPWRYIGMGVTRSPEEGGESIIQVATSQYAATGGQYFCLPKGRTTVSPIHSSEESYDEAKAKELWDLSLKTWGMM